MADKHILHMVTPLKHISPFDINMAVDAGFDAVTPYTNATLEEVTGLVQDAIFSRPPKLGVKTGMFFGGKNAILALDMLAAAKKALVPPFGISLFADPAGSFTTAAAMVACVEKLLHAKKQRDLRGVHIAVFGATGVVRFSASVIAALEGAAVTLIGYDGVKRVSEGARDIKARFGVDVAAADGSTETKKQDILSAVRAATATSGPGLALMVEMLGLGVMAEVPAVVFVSQRGGPSTGLPTKTEQSDLNIAVYGGHGDAPRIVIAPTNVDGCYRCAGKAFEMAEAYQTPVIVLLDMYLSNRSRP